MNRILCTPAAAPVADDRAASAPFRLHRKARRVEYLGNDEPSLDEVLADEVILRVMARDGVRPDEVLALAGHVNRA